MDILSNKEFIEFAKEAFFSSEDFERAFESFVLTYQEELIEEFKAADDTEY